VSFTVEAKSFPSQVTDYIYKVDVSYSIVAIIGNEEITVKLIQRSSAAEVINTTETMPRPTVSIHPNQDVNSALIFGDFPPHACLEV